MCRHLLQLSVLILTLTAARAGAQTCTTHAECADLDGNIIRDDGCVWSGCVGGECMSMEIHFGDMKGSESCFPDGAVDGNDAGYGVLNCFQNTSYSGYPPYACEDNAPQSVHSDAGGRFGACAPDGVCDIHDRYHAANAFAGISLNNCTCPLDDPVAPAPPAPTSESQVHVFMAPDGLQASVPATGNTTILMEPDSSATVIIWAQVSASSAGAALGGYQIIFEDSAQPVAGAKGTVGYVDVNPGDGGGNSLVVDDERSDWIFADGLIAMPIAYTESPLGFCGLLYRYLDGVDFEPRAGIHYLAAFKIETSADAYGEFELDFVREQIPGFPRPLSDLVQSYGYEYPVDQWQNLTILVGECVDSAPCADSDGNGIRDDGCVWWGCDGGLCLATDVAFADMGGAIGACEPDGTADANDRFHALNCFADLSTSGQSGYPCEAAPPAAFNVDAGGPFGDCAPDGVCDGNDAFHALNAFSGMTTCSCPAGGPAPVADDAAPAARRRAAIAAGRDRSGTK